MFQAWWGLPGPAGFVGQLERDIRDGRSLVLSLPRHAPTGLREALADRVRAADSWSCAG